MRRSNSRAWVVGLTFLKNDGQVKLARLTVDFALSILGDQ